MSELPEATGFRRVDQAILHDFGIFQLERQRLENRRNGHVHPFLILRTADWVNVVPVTASGDLVLVRQYRAGLGALSLEIPGGIIDPGEAPVEAARRELLEETGYQADAIEPLGIVSPNPAIQNNRCHLFLARDVRLERAPALDASENIEVLHVPVARLHALLDSGAIVHALAWCALLRAAARFPG